MNSTYIKICVYKFVSSIKNHRFSFINVDLKFPFLTVIVSASIWRCKPIFSCNSCCGYPNALQKHGHLCLVMMNNEWKNEVNCIFHSWEIRCKRLRIFSFHRVLPGLPRPKTFCFNLFLIFSIIPFNTSKNIDNLRVFSFLYSTTLMSLIIFLVCKVDFFYLWMFTWF